MSSLIAAFDAPYAVLTGEGHERAHARHVDEARRRARRQEGQERLDRVDGAPEVDVHDPLDVFDRQLRDRDELLDDARHVHEPIHLAVGLLDRRGQLLDGLAIRDVDLVRGEAVARIRESRRLGESVGAEIERRDLPAPPQQLEHDLAADPVAATRDGEHLACDLH